jgi:hypothetical protein
MEKLRALHSYGYGTRALQPGDEFEADENDAALIVEMGQAERVKSPSQRSEKKPTPDTQSSSDDTPLPEPAQPQQPKKKRGKRGGYLRRDERAQD